MIKYIIYLFFIINTIVLPVSTNILSSNKFSINLENEKIILENFNNNCKYLSKPIIKYENIFEDIYETESDIISKANPKYKVMFDDFNINKNYIISSMKFNNSDTYFEVKYQMITDKTLLVSFYISSFEFKDTSNDLLVSLSFNKLVNYDSKYYLEVDDYVINFSNNTDNFNKVTIERFGNYFYVHLPYFADELYYNFTISYVPNF